MVFFDFAWNQKTASGVKKMAAARVLNRLN